MTGFLDGRVAVVTGGSRGLGRAICLALAREGANVAFNFHKSEADAADVVKAIEGLGRKAWAFKVSVLDRPGLQAMARTLEQEAGRIDILVNNAGIGQVVPLALMEEADWDKVMDTNVKGAFLVTQALMRGMLKRNYGRVINISSLAGVKMMEAPVHYCTAKAALKGFTEALAKEIGRYGITVNCVAPGILEDGVSVNLPEQRMQDYLRNCALGRRGTFAECAEVVAFLASERNSYMNGTTILLDGAV